LSISAPSLLSIKESPIHPDFSAIYSNLGIAETATTSMRKAIAAIKKQSFDFVVCEFMYRYGSDYAGCTISNLDVMLASLQKYSPDARVIALVDKTEQQYIARLTEHFPLHAALVYPVDREAMQQALSYIKGV
jgi:hypothetical protein